MRTRSDSRGAWRRIPAGQTAGGLALAGVAGAAAYVLARPRLLRWGATASEAAALMPGDRVVERPDYVTTRAITIRARPEEIWPWLVQMGYRRGGLYSYDWLDRVFGFLDRPSADEILPDFQRLAVGDAIPLGRGPNWAVRELSPGRALVLEPVAGAISWTFALVPRDDHSTRLITRVRCRTEHTLRSRIAFAALDPAAFVMTRKMLLNIQRRAEALARRREARERAAPRVTGARGSATPRPARARRGGGAPRAE